MEIDLFIFHYLPQQLPFSKLSLSLSPLRVSAACNFPKQQEQWNKIDVFFYIFTVSQSYCITAVTMATPCCFFDLCIGFIW